MTPPPWLNAPDVVSHAVSYLGLAIKSIDSSQRHIGVLHGPEHGPVRFLHLAFHHDLRDEEPTQKCFWVSPNVPRAIRRSLASVCRLVAVAHCGGAGLPYGLEAGAWFDRKTGKVVLGNDDTGLTCATFVLALFRSYNIELLDRASWPARSEDDRWLRKICDALRDTGAPHRHVERLERRLGNFQRFRPEEVAAGSVQRRPAGFIEASAGGRELVRFLNSRHISARALEASKKLLGFVKKGLRIVR